MKYRIKIVLMCSGERLPVLLNGGIPLYYANLYALTDIRGRNLASNTIMQALRAVLVLYLFLDDHKIDLEERLEEGLLLAPNEIEALAVFCRMTMVQMTKPTIRTPERKTRGKVILFEKARQRMVCADFESVCPAFVLTRMLYIRNFILWLINNVIVRFYCFEQ